MDTEDQQRIQTVTNLKTQSASVPGAAAAVGTPVHDQERIRSIIGELGRLVEGSAVRAFMPQAGKVYEGVALAVKEGHLIQRTGQESVTLHRVDSLVHDNHSLAVLADAVRHQKDMVIGYDHSKVPTLTQKELAPAQKLSHAKEHTEPTRDRGFEQEGM